MDVRKILKVYNYVNDDKRPKVNLKFVAVYAAFLLSVVAMVGFFAAQRLSGDGTSGPGPGSDGSGVAATSHRERVGLSQEEIAAGTFQPGTADQRLAAWKAEHPNYVIDKQEAESVGPAVVAYWVTYHLA